MLKLADAHCQSRLVREKGRGTAGHKVPTKKPLRVDYVE